MAKTVRLYYLGGLTPAGVNSQPITSVDQVFMLPKPGQYLEVPVHVANDLERKYAFEMNDGSIFRPFTRNKRLIDQMKQMRSGTPSAPINPEAVKAVDTNLLVAELKARGINVDPIPDDDDDDNDTTELESVSAAPKRGRPRKESA